nr:putative ribonuclease H-like domain-containing protein [Tanacetum cinerariifolium]
MYSVDLKNIVPKGGLTCLFAKATSDESKLWHRRLGHLSFKTMNKLVKGNLVRGLPSKLFDNDQNCVTCQKRKQHKASCKTKTENSISLPLHLLHMDLFGPTFVKSLMKKMYCLVVTNDYSRFTWFFFLATKYETSGILKSFITRIENLVDHKVKVIRCDNGTEFKNREMNQFCEMNGILRQYSVARNPQQNRVAEKRNRTLIEAARTMLVDSKLPTTFWAEAVTTACYVQNRLLVVKPHNKTPYELFYGRTPSSSFMRPFGSPDTNLNTLDHLGKFDSKADEYFFVEYSLNSKAFRVFNSRIRIVEENLHIRFSESTPNVVGSEPDWLFDIDALTRIINYEPIIAGTQYNGFDDGFKPLSDDGKKFDEDPSKGNKCNDQEKEDNVNITNNVNIVSSTVNAAGTNGVNIVGELPFDPDMPALKDMGTFDFLNKDEDDDAVADMNNLDITIKVSHTLTTRIHKDHPLDQVIGDLQLTTQTRNMTKNLEEHSAFLYGKIKEDVYVCQSLGFEDPDFPDRVYKVEKALYRLHQALRAWFTKVKNASTPMETQKPLLKDEDGEEVDVHIYRNQVNPKVSHLHVVKRIFKYLKGQPKLGLLYPKDSSFDLVAYTDNDYARASLDRKSTTRCCQFLGYEEGVYCLPNSTIFEKLASMRKPTRKVTEVPRPSDPMEHVVDEAVHKELSDRLSMLQMRMTTRHYPEEHVKHKKKDQIGLDEESALKLQAKFAKEQRLAREKAEKELEANIALTETLDDVQARIDVDHKLAERLQAEEQQELTDEEQATLAIKRVNTFEPIISELVEGKEKRAGEKLIQKRAKKQKVENDKETTELTHLMEIILNEEDVAIDVIPLAVKSPRIIDWKIHKEGKKSYYQIIRADRKSKMYMFFSQMLERFDREDLEDLYKLVFMLVEKTYPLTPSTLTMMLEKKLQNSWNEDPCNDVHQVGDEKEVEVLHSLNWPPSELIMKDGVLTERGYSQFNDVAQPQVNPDSTIAQVEHITLFRYSGIGSPTTLEHVASCIIGREAYCSTGFEGRIVGCKPNPTSAE